MFTNEGKFQVTVKKAYLAEPKFNQNAAFDVCLEVETQQGETGFWTGEVSDDYGKGNFSDKRQWEITLMTLEKLGWENGRDFSKIASLEGVQTVATVKGREYEGKTYYDVKYIGDSGFGPKALSADSISKRMNMFGSNQPSLAPPPSGPAASQQDLPKNATPAENPFA